MRFRPNARLDPSQVEDVRGRSGGLGGGGIAVGGGGLGLVGLIVVVLINVLGGGSGTSTGAGAVPGFGGISQGGTADNSELEQDCKSGADANRDVQCAAVAEINSIQDFWEQQLGGGYQRVDTVFFSGQVQTQCGAASSGSGPFYCPADKLVYIDITFFDDLKNQFGAEGGTFVDAYVLAHEYGHHVQDQLGTLGTTEAASARQGAQSAAVRVELQADCYAGVWMNNATRPQGGRPAFITEITQADLDTAVDAATRIGDDYIQGQLGGGTVDPDSFTHGTSAQRKKWFQQGFNTGDPRQCDTFSTSNL